VKLPAAVAEAPITVPSMLPPLISTVARVDVPDAPNVVNEPVLGVVAPRAAPSIVPPLISAVAATREVLALSVVNVPATGVAEPITALSIAPELRSTDVMVVVPVADKLANVARPVNADVPVVVSVPPIATLPVAEIPPLRNKSWKRVELLPKSTLSLDAGSIALPLSTCTSSRQTAAPELLPTQI
jgi:hypothetical protein